MTAPRALDLELERTPAAQCELLASAVQRLCPDRRNPEAFHETKSAVVAELRRLGRRLVVRA